MKKQFLYVSVVVLMLLAAAMLLTNRMRECFIFLGAGAVIFAYAEYSERKASLPEKRPAEAPPAEPKETAAPTTLDKVNWDEWVKAEKKRLEAEIEARGKT